MKTKHGGIVLLFVLTLITASCASPVSGIDPARIPVKLIITSPPNKLEYELNERFESTGLRVASACIDGSTRNEYISDSNISGFDSSRAGVKTITVTANGLSATFTVTVRSSTSALASLSISSLPNKRVYELYENADWSGLEVRETYSDNSSRIETNYYNYTISGFDSSITGEQTITVTKSGISATFTVTVNPPFNPETVLVSLSVSSLPNKRVYELGESADWTGLTVMETYSDNSSRIETDYHTYSISGFNAAISGGQTITVTKRGISATFTITVNPPLNPETVLVSLSISSLPYKLTYDPGENSDWSGLEVTGTYSDGNSRVETSYDISYFDPWSVGEQTIAVTKNSLSAAFTVTVRDLVSLSISSLPYKLVYELYENSDWSGLEVTGTYSDGSSRVETSYNIDSFYFVDAGEHSITVTKTSLSASLSATFTITVNPPFNPETVLVSLSISSLPYKLVYELYENSDWSGLEVTETYSDNSSRIETNYYNYSINGFDSANAGEQTITITKNDISATFTVTVRDLVSLSISSLPYKLVYELYEYSDWSGLEVTGTYSDGSSRVETSYTIDSFYFVDAGEHSITVSKNSVTTTFTIIVRDLVSLSISSLPDKLVYELYEYSDWTGLEVTGTYSDGSSRIETSYDIGGFDYSITGEQTITVSKNSISATFTVIVRGLVSLSISSLPDKLVYELYEYSDWTGLEVTGTYSDGSARVETSYDDISGFDAWTMGEQTITVSKNSISATFTVTVRGLVSLSISSLPDKLVYEQNESADWTGLEVTGTYSDGSSRIETSYDFGGFDNWYVGEKSITVSKNGISAEFAVTVIRLDSLSVSSQPDKLEYEPGDNPNWTGMVVEGTYFDGSNTWNEIIDHGNYDIGGFDSSSPGVKTIEVSKNGVYTWFTVTVEGLSSLSISSEPNKKVYELGESPDWTGLIVVGNYFIKNPQIETIDYDSEISGFDSSSPGIKTITITKNGVSISPFTIEILPGGNGVITILPPFHTEDITLTPAGATVTAPGGYTDYQWFVDDMPRPADSGSDGKAITLSAPDYASGTYRVWVIAHKQGLPYSGETYVTLP
jgi:hypothetical protein